jgi:hypothetical protein
MAKGMFVPILVGYQTASITPAMVNLINDKVYRGLKIGAAGFWVFVGFAALLALVGALTIGLTIRRVRGNSFYFDRAAYERINADS